LVDARLAGRGRSCVPKSRLTEEEFMPLVRTAFAAAIAAGALVMAPSSPAKTVSWSQSFHDAGHTGFNGKEKTLTPRKIAGIQLLWGQSVEGGVTDFALDDGVIYAQGQGSAAPNLAAIDAATGASLWTVVTGDGGLGLNGTVVATKTHVIAGCTMRDDSGNPYGALCGFKKGNGRAAWNFANPCNCLPEAGMMAAPVLANGVVYFGYGNGGISAAEYVVAADADTGQVLWTSGTGTANTLGSSTPVVADGLVFFTCAGDGFHGICAVSQANGALVWSLEMGTMSIGLSADKGVLYANVDSDTDKVAALDDSNGDVIWTFPYAGGQSPVAVAKTLVYALGDDHTLYALRASDGAQQWTTVAGAALSTASIAGKLLYINGGCCYTGTLPSASAFDAKTGEQLWTGDHSATTLNPPPIVANGVLYYANGPCGSICAFGLTMEPQAR
jgi:outer membrane protein assembly factor BamB